MLFEINRLFTFYANQYGMIFDTIYDLQFDKLKGRIIFRNVEKNFCIECHSLSEEEIVGYLHTIIYDVLIEAGNQKMKWGGM